MSATLFTLLALPTFYLESHRAFAAGDAFVRRSTSGNGAELRRRLGRTNVTTDTKGTKAGL